METNKIANVLDFFTGELVKAICETQKKFSSKIILGYHSSNFRNEVEGIRETNHALNSIIAYYQELFNITVDGTNIAVVFDQILKLTEHNETLPLLKRIYIENRKIEIPNFPNFKVSALIEAYDFKNEDLELMNLIAVPVSDISKKKISKEHLAYFSNDEFVLSNEQEEKILEGHTKYASTEQLGDIMSLHLFCEGLSSLKKVDYTYKQLPEIPISIMSKIKIDHKNGFEKGISVNIDGLNNGKDVGNYFGVNQNPTGGFRFKKKIKEY